MAAASAPPTGAPAGDLGDAIAVARDFVVDRVIPQHAALEAGDDGLLRALLAEAGSRGTLVLPTSREIAAEAIGAHASFALSATAHGALSREAIARCGSDVLRATLPDRDRGERVGALALADADGGSDPLAMRTRARRDGRDWIVSGRKQLVSNASICDDVAVFAHADAAGPTALVVPREAVGVHVEPRAAKLGLRGAGTCTITFRDVRVGAEALLESPGRGHRAAFEILPTARLRSGSVALGQVRFVTAVAARRARERKQFGQSIAAFGSVAAAIGEMVARAFVVESLLRRAALELVEGDIDEKLPLSSACKVMATETLVRAADLAMTVHAGHGYCEGAWPEQAVRDAPGLRMYDGTNEIARRLAYGSLRKLVVRESLVLDDEVQGDAHNRERTTARSLAAWLRVVLRSSVRVASGSGDAALAGRDELEACVADLAFATAAADAAQARGRAASASFSSDAHLAALAADAGVLLLYQNVMPASQALRVALGREVPALPLPMVAGPAFDLPAALVALGRAAVDAGRDPLAAYDFPILPDPR